MAFFRKKKEEKLLPVKQPEGTGDILSLDRKSRYTKRERKILLHQLALSQEQEKELFESKLKDPDKGIQAKAREKAPQKIMDKVRSALIKGFILIFTKATPAIEAAGGLKKKKLKAELNIGALDKGISLGAIQRVDEAAADTASTNKSITSVEGAVMGLFGWGPQDSPIFLAVILKSIYEVAASYGFDYNANEEKRYIIALMNAALADPFEKIALSKKCDEVGLAIDLGNGDSSEIGEEELQEAAEKIADSILILKVLMMIKVAGTFSAVTNYKMVKQVTEYAKVKYRQRFLFRLLMR
ncbi:MAG: EcsC family protein [Anaerovoracaceae bacterium]|jgi:hypothetical protein